MDAIDRILQLLTLIEKQATVVPHLKHLSVAALNELTKMNDDAAKAHAEKTAADAKKAAEAEAKKAAEDQAKAAKAQLEELDAQKKAEADLRAKAAQAPTRPMGEPAQKASDVSKDKLSL